MAHTADAQSSRPYDLRRRLPASCPHFLTAYSRVRQPCTCNACTLSSTAAASTLCHFICIYAMCVCVACTHQGITNMSMLLVADAAVAAHLERETKRSNEAAAKKAGQLSITSIVERCDPIFVKGSRSLARMTECAQQSKDCSVHEPCCTKAPPRHHYTIAWQTWLGTWLGHLRHQPFSTHCAQTLAPCDGIASTAALQQQLAWFCQQLSYCQCRDVCDSTHSRGSERFEQHKS